LEAIVTRTPLFAAILCSGVLLLAACEKPVEDAGETIRPVTALTLEVWDPAREGRRVGLAVPYRQEDIGFEVGGRIEVVLNAGVEVTGTVRDENRRVVRQGDVIAVLDSTRYVQALKSLEARVAAREASVAAQRVDVEQVQQATVELARVNYKRQLDLVQAGAATQEGLDDAKANLDVAEATLQLKQAQVEAGEAEIADLVQSLETAKLDLENCVLRAPFSGRITAEHATRGGYVSTGQPVVTLTLLDPMKISVAVSAEDERRIPVGSTAMVFPSLESTSLSCPARVKEKSQVADPSTRTFEVEVMTRNVRRQAESRGFSVQAGFMPTLRRHHAEEGPLYVPVEALREEGGKAYVYLVEGARFWDGGATDAEQVTPKKVEVELGDDYWSILSWNLREVACDQLDEGSVVIADPKPSMLAGVSLTHHEWVMRPGDMVAVGFDLGNHPAGFYLPIQAISELNGETTVFLVVDGRAKRTPVEVHESYRELRRVSGEGLGEGAQVVLGGAHFLADGERVSVSGGTP
jgi:RND family efflux transporter MFP subunit